MAHADPRNSFRHFAPFIKALPGLNLYEKDDLLIPELLWYSDDRLSIYYAPFDYVNEFAQVVLLGITPGWEQMQIAFQSARHDLVDGLSMHEICLNVKRQASFAGSMRNNLISMLDELDLPRLLGIPSSASLFSEHFHLVHTASAVRYPVYADGENYTGHSPPILKVLALGGFDRLLVEELERLPHAVIIPLGNSVTVVLEHLCARKLIDRDRCLFGFPHPSGANGHRHRQFREHRDMLAQGLNRLLS